MEQNFNILSTHYFMHNILFFALKNVESLGDFLPLLLMWQYKTIRQE